MEAALREDCVSDKKDTETQDEPQLDPVRKGSDPLSQSLRHKLNLQISRELRLRTGAENLLRVCNPKVKETVALELSLVNNNLQLLRQELKELNSNMYQDHSESVNVPMIPLGLKETKEVDFSVCIKDFISEHYGEDSSTFEPEITELNQLREAVRTPCRDQAGLQLLMEYYNQLYYIDQRFCKPHTHLGALFHWYDSLTGVPSCQKALAFEKGSVVFNIGALYTQMAARQDRSVPPGIEQAIQAFQRAAGAFRYLQENFCNAPSLDMSELSLSLLLQLMKAQALECVHERTLQEISEDTLQEVSEDTLQEVPEDTLQEVSEDMLQEVPEDTLQEVSEDTLQEVSEDTLQEIPDSSTDLLRLAQEAASVAEAYSLVFQSMSQLLMKDYVPFSWTSIVHVKLQFFRAQSHYYTALALTTYMEEQEEALVQFYSHCPLSAPITHLLREPERRRKLCKSHLRSAVIGHEEALRLLSQCKVLKKMNVLQSVLSQSHRRSLDLYSQLDREDDFEETRDAPEIQPHSKHSPEPIPPDFSSVQVSDLFHKLGPLCVFCARARWGPLRVVVLPQRGESSLGLTLRGDAPVLVAAVVPGAPAQEAGLREGDYIVAVNGVDTKWSKHREVVELLQNCPEPVISVVTLHTAHLPLLPQVEGSRFSQSVDKESTVRRSKCSLLNTRGRSSLLNWSRKNKHPEVSVINDSSLY